MVGIAMVSIAITSRAEAIGGTFTAHLVRAGLHSYCGATYYAALLTMRRTTYYAAHLVRRVHGGDDSGLVKGEEAAAPN